MSAPDAPRWGRIYVVVIASQVLVIGLLALLGEIYR